jgi:hypothetical protein
VREPRRATEQDDLRGARAQGLASIKWFDCRFGGTQSSWPGLARPRGERRSPRAILFCTTASGLSSLTDAAADFVSVPPQCGFVRSGLRVLAGQLTAGICEQQESVSRRDQPATAMIVGQSHCEFVVTLAITRWALPVPPPPCDWGSAIYKVRVVVHIISSRAIAVVATE